MEPSQLIKILRDVECGTDVRVRKYSGRGMFGSECVGLEYDGDKVDTILDIVAAAQESGLLDDAGLDLADLVDALRNASYDSMGRGGIMYWPRHRWPEDVDADSDEEQDDAE